MDSDVGDGSGCDAIVANASLLSAHGQLSPVG
jgi:hypothetical protein